jgi:hypothetical protein
MEEGKLVISGSEVRGLGRLIEVIASLAGSLKDKIDAERTKLDVGTALAADVKLQDFKREVEMLELSARKADAEGKWMRAEATMLRADIERTRAQAEWDRSGGGKKPGDKPAQPRSPRRHQQPRQVQKVQDENSKAQEVALKEPTSSVVQDLKEGSREVRRGFSNDALKNGLAGARP